MNQHVHYKLSQDGRAFWMLVHVLSEWAHTPALALAYLGC